MFGASKTASGSNLGPSDPYYEYVTMLLTGDGTNGAQNNTFVDSSTNNFSITRNGNTTQGSFSPYGSNWGVNFGSSSTEVISVPASTDWDFGSGSFTMECWIFPTQNMTDSWIAAIYNSYTWNWRIATTNKLMFYWNNFGSSYTSTGTITLNQWNHIVLVSNGTTAAFFINGTRDSTNSAPNINNDSGTNPLYIGNQLGGSDRRLYGELSNLRIVKGSAVYDPTQSTLTVPTSPLTAITNTKLLVLQSNRFIDNSSSNRTLTVTSGTTTPSIQRFSPFNPTVPYSTATIGGSGYFDGTGDYLSIANNAAIQLGTTYTIEGWFYTNTTTNQRYFGKFSSGVGGWLLLASSTDFTWFFANNGAYTISATVSIPMGAWNHIAIATNGSTMRVWLNGTSVGSYSSPPATQDDGNALRIGSYNGVTGGLFNGYISNFRIVNGSDVYGVSNTTITVPTAPLTAITNTSLLCNMTNAGIYDNAMMNDLETIGNAQISTSVVKYGTGSIAFDGTSDGLVAPASPNAVFGTGNFTIEWWQYWNSISGYQTIYSNNYISANNILVQTDNGTGKYRVFMNDTNATLTETNAASTGQWYHYALVRNGSTLTMYRNGTANGSVTSSASVGVATVITEIGQGNNSFSINGYIDDFRITKGYARYTANFTPPTTALPTY